MNDENENDMSNEGDQGQQHIADALAGIGKTVCELVAAATVLSVALRDVESTDQLDGADYAVQGLRVQLAAADRALELLYKAADERRRFLAQREAVVDGIADLQSTMGGVAKAWKDKLQN